MAIRIKDVCEVNKKSLTASDISKAESFSYLDISNLKNNNIAKIEKINSKKLPSRAKRVVKKNDVLFSTVRPEQEHHGILTNPPSNLVASTGYTVLTVDETQADPHYLYYYLTNEVSNERMKLIARTSVSSYPSLKPEDIANLKYTEKSLDYQIKIGKLLSHLQEKINLNREEIKVLQKYVKLLFHHWFFEFNFDNHNSHPYKKTGGKMKKISGKVIPLGWNFESLDSLIHTVSNGDWGSEVNNEKCIETYCIRGADIPNIELGKIGDTPLRYIKSVGDNQKNLNHGDIVIEASGGSSTQSTGRAVLIRNSFLKNQNKPVYFSNFSKRIVPHKSYACFVYLILDNLYERNIFFHYEGKTSGIKNLLISNMLKRIKIVLPPLEIANKFEEKAGSIYDRINILGHENELLSEHLDLLRKKYVK